ncbi:ArnT family glycosyltransferase [Frondihabitans australicus]|uniref:4-amino-4-deoxy-L-arabinose transferase-like glycosyltransferase n=1 Tax=Frondihabitans australicus TaxID=386892 RepID=A0A495ICL8_9MICO|nr:glycosyltransferase family 39 protein [Frondihabitans australicus]RKR73380.1 4-amino-4-deoxy-L-arabinose transferase-like glycosyltransferase [Frondihabitans australicus]
MTTTTERPAAPPASPITLDTSRNAAPVAPRSRVRDWLGRHGATLSWLLPVLAIVGVVQRINMTGSPQRIDDEGTYTAQAWAIGHLGELTHYTYWYDHPPLGWIQIAGYLGLTDGWARYSQAVYAGREAMLFFALVSVLLVWLLGRRIGLGRPAAAVGALVFGVSPLAIQYHRTVYLDNVAVPWLLLAFWLAMTKKNQLAGFVGAAFAFGIAVLSKETFLLALPFLAWTMIRSSDRSTRRYTLATSGAVLALVGFSYVALAAVKGELLPGKNHTSLITGLTFQLGTRNSSGSIFDTKSLFFQTVSQWWNLDQVFIVLALLAAISGLFFRRTRPFAALVVFAVAVMFRPNSYVPVPYVIMVIPFGALLIAAVSDSAVRAYRERRGGAITTTANRIGATAWLVAAAVAVAAIVPLWTTQLRGFVAADLDSPMVGAEKWVDDNVPHSSRLLVDDSMWVDLVNDGFARDNVIWFYKLDTDSAVRAQNPNGWKDSDYVIETNSVRTSAYAEPNIKKAVANSTVVASFGTGTQQVTVRQIHPQGLAAYQASAKAQAAARAAMGAQLAANRDLTASSQVVTALKQGRVNARAEIVLGQLLATGPVTVSNLSTLPGESSEPYRRLVLKASALPGAQLDAWLEGVGDAYRPSTVTPGGGGTAVAVFPAVDTITTTG